VGSTCGGDLAATTCTILKRREACQSCNNSTLLFLQYYYKYITVPHILQKIRDKKKENLGSQLRCNASELV